MNNTDIQKLAEKHGLILVGEIKFNEMGIDFKVGFATDNDGKQWLLRIPRRSNLGEQINREKRILQLVGGHLSVQVPEWRIATEELVAYPLLNGEPALTFDAETYEINWNMEKNSPHYIHSLARVLVEIHSIPEKEAVLSDLKHSSPEALRTEVYERLHFVKTELGIGNELDKRFNRWLDNDALWPDYTRFIHGDLYAGHILTYSNGRVCGVIDWTTAHIGDVSLDFSGHFTVFGEESLRELISEYEKQGGKTWDTIFEQTIERAAAAPLVYGYFALETQDEFHLNAARIQLGA